ncbi:MAG: hypothetical protein RLZZ182_2116, partial [Pseudomonadota bacterium]
VPMGVDVLAVLATAQTSLEAGAAAATAHSPQGLATLGFPAPFQRWLTGR